MDRGRAFVGPARRLQFAHACRPTGDGASHSGGSNAYPDSGPYTYA